MNQISKQNNSQVSIITIVSRKYKDRQTDCQQKNEDRLLFPHLSPPGLLRQTPLKHKKNKKQKKKKKGRKYVLR
jgi:hypothetical protein